MRHRFHLFTLFLLFLFLFAISTPAFAASITVESGDDDTLPNLAGNGTCDLREAILAANTNSVVDDCPAGTPGADTIDLDGFTVFAAATFTIADDVTIQNGTVDGGSATQLFLVNSSVGNVTFANMTLQNGSSTNGGAIQIGTGNVVTISGSYILENAATTDGGAIYSDSPLFIEYSSIDDNTAGNNGGGIHSTAAVTVTASSVSGNNASIYGGGIFASGNVTVEAESIFESNSASAGGAILATSPVNISDSGFFDNEALAGNGGAVRALAALTISASGFIENRATGAGGAIESGNTHTITDSFFFDNLTTTGTGVGGAIYAGSGTGTISGTLFGGNESGLNGGSLYVNGAAVTVTDTIIAFGFADGTGGAVYINSGSASVTGSCIEGNSDTAVFNNTAPIANFTGNWWGTSDGPAPTGSGDSVEGNVDFSGFLTAAPDDIAGQSCFELGPAEPMMSLNKDNWQESVTPGTETTYMLTFANIADDGSVFNIVITDPIPAQTTFVGCGIMPPLTGSCDVSGGVVTLTINEALAEGESGTAFITFMVNPDATGAIVNEAQLDYEDICGCAWEPIFANDTDIVNEIPVIEVFQDGFTPIPNGTGTATFVGSAGSPIVSTIEIRNTGTADLTLTEPISLTGTGFSLLGTFGTTTVAPGSSTSFSVQCDAVDAGVFTGSISFENGDLNATPFTFALECQVDSALIEVFQGGFTPIPNNTGMATFVGMAGTPIVSSFEIRNTGTANLTLTEPINLTGTGFTLVNSFGNTTVEPGSNTTFDVQCDAAADGMYTGSISFGTNDPTANPFTFALECQVGDIIDVLPTTLPDGSVNTPYTQAITATGGSGSYTFAVTGGTLPPGLTLEADGTLSGTPTQGGTYNFTITATDTVTSFYGYRNYTVRIDAMVPTVPPPPPTPVCEDHNFAEGGVVRASTVDGIDYAVNCRILYQNGQPTQWLGGNLYNAGAIGIQGVLDLGVIQAVDIFSPVGMTYFEGGAVFCLRGQGTLIWMAAKNAPRVAEIIGSYTVDEFPGFTCSTLFEPGTLVLVRDNPIQ